MATQNRLWLVGAGLFLGLAAVGCRLAVSDDSAPPQVTASRDFTAARRGDVPAPTARGGGPTATSASSADRVAADAIRAGWSSAVLAQSNPSATGGGPGDTLVIPPGMVVDHPGPVDHTEPSATPTTMTLAQPSGPTMSTRSFTSAAVAPEHGQPFGFSLGPSVADVEPPTHTQAQPMVLALDARCEDTEPRGCEPTADAAAPFGWLVCVRERASCMGADPTDVANEALRRADRAAGSGVMHRGGVIVAHGADAQWVDGVRAGEPTRWPYVLLVEPLGGDHGFRDLFADGQPPTRVAFLEPRMPLDRGPTRRLEQRLRDQGVETGWFLAPSGSSARDGAMRRAMAWLFAGSESDLCAPNARTSATREGSAPLLCSRRP